MKSVTRDVYCRETNAKDPFLNKPFNLRLKWFIGVFDVFDQEEELGKVLGREAAPVGSPRWVR